MHSAFVGVYAELVSCQSVSILQLLMLGAYAKWLETKMHTCVGGALTMDILPCA